MTPEFAKALVAAQKATYPVYKQATNPAFRSKYADLAAVVEATIPALNDAGISVLQMPDFDGEQLILTTVLMHVSGDSLTHVMRMPVSKRDPQGIGSATTYARRYSLLAMTGAAPEDDDGNAASGPAPAAKKSSAQAKKDGDWDRIMAAINGCDTEQELDTWWAKMERFWGQMPASWPDAAANEVEKRRNEILDRLAEA